MMKKQKITKNGENGRFFQCIQMSKIRKILRKMFVCPLP